MKALNSIIMMILAALFVLAAPSASIAETACEAGAFLNLGDGKCYRCPNGYLHNALLPADVEGVCYKPSRKLTGTMGQCGSQSWVKTCSISDPFEPSKCLIWGGYWNKTGCASNATFQVQDGNKYYNCFSGNLSFSSWDILVPFNDRGICYKWTLAEYITATPVAAKKAGDQCVGLFQGNCGNGLICDGGTHLCRHDPPELGEACGLGVECRDDGPGGLVELTCFAGTCKNKGGSTEACDILVGNSSCSGDLVCDVRGECRGDPPNQVGEFCGVLEPCDGDLTCFNGRCANRADATESCDPLVENSCKNSLECVSDSLGITWECRHKPPELGEICGLGDTCADGLYCDELLHGGRCEQPKQANERCVGTGQGNCRAGLVCDDGLLGNGLCRHPVPWEGERCGAGVACTTDSAKGAPLRCSADVGGVCEKPKRSGDSCTGLGQGNCADGLACALTYDLGGVTEFEAADFNPNNLGSRCTPAPQPGLESPVSPEMCREWRSLLVPKKAELTGKTISEGSTVALSGVVAGSLEHGTVYAPNGDYGCYLTTCVGADFPGANVGWCFGYENQFPSDGEQETQAVVGFGFSQGVSLSFAAIDELDDNGVNLDGASACVEVGVGLGIVTGGVYQCNTQVTLVSWDANDDGIADTQAAELNLDPAAADGDTDGDGLTDVDELGADLSNPLDSDGDGVIDALEPNPESAFPYIAKGLPLPDGGTATISVDSAQLLSDVRTIPLFGAPAGVQFPFGVIAFTSSTSPGFLEPVTVEVSSGLPVSTSIFRINSNGDFIELPSAMWSKLSGSSLRLDLTDGSSNDLDLLVNGQIEFQFAIGKRDFDNDGILNNVDNCPYTPNADQEDSSPADGIGDDCADDLDNDGVLNAADVCPYTPDPAQEDEDTDGQGDACDSDDDGDGVDDDVDNCPRMSNPTQSDIDNDNIGDSCDSDKDGDRFVNHNDNCPTVYNAEQNDIDADGIGDLCDPDNDNDGVNNDADNCPFVENADQANADGDDLGDLCDPDADGDAIEDTADNCPLIANDQSDLDGDSLGDACDDDKDGDTIENVSDNCPADDNFHQDDTDADGMGDACDTDKDGDGILNDSDNCPVNANGSQLDTDFDASGDACDEDDDNDGFPDEDDNCPLDDNPLQLDDDGDGMGNACDPDTDNDGLDDNIDNCPLHPNLDQLNSDDDTFGDACDDDDDNDGQADGIDNCPIDPNPLQEDSDGDNEGDACDSDLDGDGVLNDLDNCLAKANADQANNDGDAYGDVCDPDDDNDTVLDVDDSCPFEDATGFDVDIDGCIDSFEALDDLLLTLVSDAVIDAKQQKSLLSKLNQAAKSSSKNNICASVYQLDALIHQVNAQRDKKISSEAADRVIAYSVSLQAVKISTLPVGGECK